MRFRRRNKAQATVREAIEYLASACDGAVRRDGHGFNREHVAVGHRPRSEAKLVETRSSAGSSARELTVRGSAPASRTSQPQAPSPDAAPAWASGPHWRAPAEVLERKPMDTQFVTLSSK